MWDKITFELNTEGESVNFGTRLFNDNNIYAFETKALATIHRSATSNVDKTPHSFKPISVSHEKTICIAVENTLVIFDATCSEVLLNLHFDSRITTFKMCNDGIFLFIALNNLEIYCVHCMLGKYERIFLNAETSFQIKPQLNITNKVVSICIDHIESRDAIHLFFVFSCGMIVRLSELDMKSLNELFNCDDSQKSIENIFANVTYCKLLTTLTKSRDAVEAVCEFKRSLFISNGKILIKCPLYDIHPCADNTNSEIDIRRSSIECSLPTGIVLEKLECTQKLLLSKTADEKLIIICPFTLSCQCFLPYDTCVDFTVVKGKLEETILIFTAYKIISLSNNDFSENYIINLPKKSLPVYNQNEDDPSFEEILFVELSDEKSLTIKVLEETQPHARLEKLLRKGRFEEAKKFCTFFSLDIQLVHCAEAARMFEELMPWVQSKTVTVDKFIALLELIEDIEFVGRYCINAITADLRDIRKLLDYGMNRIKLYLSKTSKSEAQFTNEESRSLHKLHSDMGSVVLRLNTYIIIHDTSSASADQWISFSKANLLYEIRGHLRKGELNAAKTIWCRHWNEIREESKFQEAIEMLNDVPDTLSVEESADWTKQMVSNVLLNDPSSLESIISWTMKKILSLDLIDKDNWLEKGISLAELMIDILLKLEESEAAIGLEHILIEKLNSFLKTLHQISCLKNVYHTNITYNHFVEENFNEVVFFLLTKTPVDSITNLINDFLSQILMDKRLDSDSVYSYCIERLVRFLPVELVYPGAPWEIRAVKITRAIFATQTRLECVVNLLKAAAVPLSTFILETVDEALALNHPLTGAIREQLVLVPSKLVLEKYGFTEIYNDEHRESIMHFIINSEDENNLADSLIIAKTINMEDDVYTGFITKFIREGNYGKVMELMGKLEPDVRERIQKRINLQVKLMRDIDINQLQIYRQYCSSLDQDLSRSCQLELDLDIKSNVADMHKKEKNEEFADIAFKQLIHECVRDKKAIYHITQKVSKLSEIFNIPHHSIILKLASLTLCEGKGDLAIELLSYFVESTMGCIDYKLCRELLDFLGKHICNLATYIQNSLKPIEVSTMLKTLSNMCLESSHASSILQAVEISIWVNLITGCRPQVTLFSEDFPSARLFQFLPDIVNSILEKYISFADVSNNRIVQNTFRNSIIPASNYTANDIASLLKSVLNNLAQIEQSTVSLQVVTDLYCSLSSVTKNAIETVESKSENGACNEWSVVMKTESWEAQFNRCLSEILQRVIMKKVPGKHFDLTVGLAMLNGYSEEEAFCWLKNQLEANLFNAKRTMAVSILGAFYWKLKNNDNMHSTYMASILKGQWGDKLSKLGLPYKEFITMDKREVVMKLLTIPNIDLDILRDYCSAFHFDFNDCLMKYVKHLVLSWEPDMSVTVDASGARVLHVKNTTDDILVKMKSVSALVDNHLEFMEYFTIILWKEVNCYYYELYIALLELFDHVSEQLSDKTFLSREQFLSMKQYKNILKFLINYRRISPTTSQEEDLFFMDYNYMHTLPAISEFRLPFTYLVADKYTILKSELSLSTYKLWFSVSSLLLLDKSTLCSLAIYRMNLEKLTSDTNKLKEEWIHVCNEKLLEDIKECVSYIEDNEKACACLFFVVNNLPPGADQVTVAQMCYNHTAKWASGKEVGSVAQQRFEKVHKKLLKVSTTHILYKYNLARREYLDLVLDPTLLICSLYKDPAILSRTDVKLVHFPDINEAVTEIGELHKVKTASIKMELVEKWLVPDSNLDDLMMSESYTIKSVAKLTEDDNLARVCYVLRYGTPSLACNYLVSIAFTNEMQPIEVKLRALQCLIKVVTPQQILDATGKDLSDIRRYMKSLWFVYGLEQLGLNCAVKTFSSRNKLELVEEILNQQSPASATLAAHLCCEYELHNPNYWNTIFKRFIESAMLLVDQMEEFIFRLKIDWYLLDQEILSSAWNRLIFLRLSMVDELSEDKESQVKKILENISKCPSPALLKRETIMDQLKRLNCRNLCSQYAIFL